MNDCHMEPDDIWTTLRTNYVNWLQLLHKHNFSNNQLIEITTS